MCSAGCWLNHAQACQCIAELTYRTSTPIVHYVTVIEIIWTPYVIIIIFTSINTNNVKNNYYFPFDLFEEKRYY